MRSFLACLFLSLFLVRVDPARSQQTPVFNQLRALQQSLTVPVEAWRFTPSDLPNAQNVATPEAYWKPVKTGFRWFGENSRVWFRTRITVPTRFQGFPTRGAAVRLRVGMDDDGEIYVDGKLRQRFHWDDGNITLTEHARPGQTFVLAVRGINGVGDGELRFCRVTYDVLNSWQPHLDRLLLETRFLEQLASRPDVPRRTRIASALRQCAALLDLDTLRKGDAKTTLGTLAAARAKLRPLEPLVRPYRVTYVGHAHIDMNWLWTWPETIDICQRTWDSAMKLMGSFADFGFVQSQPGAYEPIRQMFPAEFARMQAASRRGQWDPVGGLWNESDTDMPSGEALVRSLFLGQRYFKQYFGRYAETGWLPDSFGHSWQLPQLYQGVGLRNFYHQRGGDSARFAWWQAPDGSQVLKAVTDHYDAGIEPDQLTEPFDNARRYGVKQSLIVFGVGDHGGGPTREQILKGKAFQETAVLPQVQFRTADAFFNQLRADPAVKALPVLDTDLQYVATGAYTSHADIKAAVRASENDLYTAETLASLAAMHGRPYPAQGFMEAWKPTAFAQFHDILCGTAIHSTYTWMHAQLAPARAFETEQIARNVDALTAAIDTRGGQEGDPVVTVWNPLSFPRDDVVRIRVPDASRFASVYDTAGRRYPIQASDSRTLVFVALQTPGFGHALYFLSTAPCEATPAARSTGDHYVLENPFVRLTVAKETGVVTEFLYKPTGTQMLAPGQSGNVLEALGDGPSAWDVRLTGERAALTTHGAKVTLAEAGPVYSVLQVEHTFRKSRFTQRITVYNGLPRIDVPTVVDWHEHETMLKVAFPLNIAHPEVRVGIPYGSITRPHNGQENPGQKWMDVTDTTRGPLQSSTPIDLSRLFNHDSSVDFDGEGRGYPRSEFPTPGIHVFGAIKVPVQMAAGHLGRPDNIACDGQTVVLPSGAVGNTLYLVGAGAPNAQETALTFLMADGKRVMRHVRLNDWMVEDRESNEVAAEFPYQLVERGRARNNGAKPHLWLTAVPVPEGRCTGLLLPEERRMHLFAATFAHVGAPTPQFGLTVLNDSKYGSDTTGGVFRLSLLRSSRDPDPNPDEGLQAFTYALWPHAGDSRTGESEQAGLALNIPLRGVLTTRHPPQGAVEKPVFVTVATKDHRNNLVAGALKHCEDGPGFILRLFETQGHSTTAILTFAQPVTVTETDLLERPLTRQSSITEGRTVRLPVGHDRIVTLHIVGLPDAGIDRKVR
jgi:alpha-mannosidase